MRRLPLLPTLFVALAVAAMAMLGVWQLQRRQEKLALLDRYAANQSLPPIAMPTTPDESVLFRRAVADCRPVRWSRDAGRAADGSSGWRAIAECRPQGDGTAFAVQMGIGSDPLHDPAWAGGTVSGTVTHAPQHRALIEGLFSHAPAELMLVADRPLPGLRPNPTASLADVPNNHLAYAVQWFLFAGIAAIIYAIALWRRQAEEPGRRAPVAAPPERG